ncbi:hypothetical protein B0H11DRAFT_1925746 [Mycena galericulata]|nr:hypothetical protein B0H11DRAFT_1925746 [Mycena galericulata]
MPSDNAGDENAIGELHTTAVPLPHSFGKPTDTPVKRGPGRPKGSKNKKGDPASMPEVAPRRGKRTRNEEGSTNDAEPDAKRPRRVKVEKSTDAAPKKRRGRPNKSKSAAPKKPRRSTMSSSLSTTRSVRHLRSDKGKSRGPREGGAKKAAKKTTRVAEEGGDNNETQTPTTALEVNAALAAGAGSTPFSAFSDPVPFASAADPTVSKTEKLYAVYCFCLILGLPPDSGLKSLEAKLMSRESDLLHRESALSDRASCTAALESALNKTKGQIRLLQLQFHESQSRMQLAQVAANCRDETLRTLRARGKAGGFMCRIWKRTKRDWNTGGRPMNVIFSSPFLRRNAKTDDGQKTGRHQFGARRRRSEVRERSDRTERRRRRADRECWATEITGGVCQTLQTRRNGIRGTFFKAQRFLRTVSAHQLNLHPARPARAECFCEVVGIDYMLQQRGSKSAAILRPGQGSGK